MFQSARIKLTLWYLVIIMAVSGFFSVIAYRGFIKELNRGFRRQSQYNGPQKRYLIQEKDGFLRILPFVLYEDEIAPEEYAEIVSQAKRRFALQLLIINGGILILAGTAGYFLAGKTLKPIEDMVGEQKRFVADASHELRTPLTAIKTETEVALRDKQLKLKDAKALLASNLEEVNKMKYFTDNLLTLSRYESNGKSLTFQKANLKDIIGEAVKRNSKTAKAKNISIKENTTDVWVRVHSESLSELFSIFINNAIKYSPSAKSISISTKKARKFAIVEVSDEGVGIDGKDIPHIFDRFFRSDSSRNKTRVEGFGLGLSIAHSIIKIHKGEIKVKSQPGLGTTFKIYLPA